MDPTYDVFLTRLPKNITDVVIKNLFSSAGKVVKVKIIEDKKNDNYKLCFVGFRTMDEALEAVRIGDNSDAFGEPIKASITKKCLEGIENNQNRNIMRNGDARQHQVIDTPNNRFANVGRGRGFQSKGFSSPPSFKTNDVTLSDIKLKLKELIEVEIIDLNRVDYIFARPMKLTANSKVEITDLLSQINSSQSELSPVESPKVNNCYLAKWDDENFYRAELLEILANGSYRVTFVDEGTSDDIVSDIKNIPAGPLQQYPKQFLKLSLGCPDNGELKDFIFQESSGKTVKIYWLGEFNSDSVPLINLFFNEDEIVEKYIQTYKNHIREKFNFKFDDMPVVKNDSSSDLKFVPSFYKSPMDFVLQLKDQMSVSLKNKKSPSVLPTPGDICIYEKHNSNVNQLFRCLIRRRQLFSFDIQLVDTGEKISNVNIDDIYLPEEVHKEKAPLCISCELEKNVSLDDNELCKIFSNDSTQFAIVQYKKNNRYVISYSSPSECKIYEYNEVDFKSLIGKGFKVTVSHVVTPLNFYVQIDNEACAKDLQDIQEKININYNSSTFKNIEDLRVNQAVVAPFIVSGSDSELFRAKILETRKQSPQVHVLFIDYGNDEWVNLNTILNADDDLVNRPGLAIHCQLNVEIKKEAWSHATEMFMQLIDSDQCGFAIQIVHVSGDKLIVDLMSQVKGSLTAVLEKSGTCLSLDESSHSSKPVCNGDIPKSHGYNDKAAGKNQISSYSEEELSLKVLDLEQRVAALEKILTRR